MTDISKQQFAEQFGRWIKPDEIVFDFDDINWGFHGINFTGINLCNADYYFQIWYCEGGKSPHLHVKNIQGLEDLRGEQLQQYKKLFMRKYAPAKYLKFLDIQLTGKHRIAEENRPHYKYGTVKRLCGVWNGDKSNFAEPELLEQAKQEVIKKKEREIDHESSGITAEIVKKISIIDIARKHGVKVRGNMAKCPFHDDKTPSLSLSDKKGLFYCHGCGVKGNIIDFIYLLRKNKLQEIKNA